MSLIITHAAVVTGLFLLMLATALYLTATPEPRNRSPRDVFGFAAARDRPLDSELPELQRYRARDGEELAYRVYESAAQRILLFIHGSSYHGGGYHRLAAFLSSAGVAKVVTPNLRGHYQSGRRRGDIDYIGQFEDDFADLIAALRAASLAGPITLGGHSSGGGLVIRFAGGPYAPLIASYLALAPILPRSPSLRDGNSGGWVILHGKRLVGLIMLNLIGIRGFNGLPLVAFNKPPQFWDGTETLSYSFRLNVSYHPRDKGRADIRRLRTSDLIVIGDNDEAIDAGKLRAFVTESNPGLELQILSGINHFGIFSEQAALDAISVWLGRQPEANP